MPVKKYPCSDCDVVYTNRAKNFSKSNRHKSGYFNDCKSCRNEKEKERIRNFSPEAAEEYKKRNREVNEKYRGSEKFKNTTENYKERRKMIRNFRNWQKRTEERLPNYVKNFYWEEKQHFFLLDIKQNEY